MCETDTSIYIKRERGVSRWVDNFSLPIVFTISASRERPSPPQS